MSYKAAKVAVSAVVMASAFGVMLYTTLGDSPQYSKYLDGAMAATQTWQKNKLQVPGCVVTESTEQPEPLHYKFKVQPNGHILTAYFNDTAPRFSSLGLRWS